ncbi:MAG TPA: O-antigen ligase family protein [Halomonas sp.]|nr:O-antigen ligase family protein [Halomonas sp.]
MTTVTLPSCLSVATSRLSHFTSLAVWFLGAFALVIPTGYSFGPALLLLGSAVLLVRPTMLVLDHHDWLIIAILAGYGLLAMVFALVGGQGVAGLDKPSRFLFAIPVLLMVMAYPPRLSWLWSGMALGAIGAGSLSGWQKLIEGAARPGGFTQAIQFGNIGMMMGVLCLAGLGWAVMQRHRGWWIGLLLLGALGGFLASIFSGSRGGWLGLPLMLLVLYRAYGREFSLTGRLVVLGTVMSVVAMAWFVPQTHVQQRVNSAVSDVSQYFSGENVNTSVGKRLEMWRGASQVFIDKPLTGWGEVGYERRMSQLVEEGMIHPSIARYRHAHNEFIDHAAKFGLVGLVSLLVLYLLPISLFAPGLKAERLTVRALATAGMLIPVAYIDFSMTQGFLTHNSGVMVYSFWLAVLWGCYRVYLGRDMPVLGLSEYKQYQATTVNSNSLGA